MLYAQTRASAHLRLLVSCELLLKLFGRSASRLALLNNRLRVNYTFSINLLGSCLYSIFHWLGHSGDMLQMRLSAKNGCCPTGRIVQRWLARAL